MPSKTAESSADKTTARAAAAAAAGTADDSAEGGGGRYELAAMRLRGARRVCFAEGSPTVVCRDGEAEVLVALTEALADDDAENCHPPEPRVRVRLGTSAHAAAAGASVVVIDVTEASAAGASAEGGGGAVEGAALPRGYSSLASSTAQVARRALQTRQGRSEGRSC